MPTFPTTLLTSCTWLQKQKLLTPRIRMLMWIWIRWRLGVGILSRIRNMLGMMKESRNYYIPDYKILKMLNKEDLINNSSFLIGNTNLKVSSKQIKPNASNYISKTTNQKSNYSTEIENLVNQAIKFQGLNK